MDIPRVMIYLLLILTISSLGLAGGKLVGYQTRQTKAQKTLKTETG